MPKMLLACVWVVNFTDLYWLADHVNKHRVLVNLIDIGLYTFLCLMPFYLCKDLVPGDFIHVLGDAHVYSTHVRPLEDQLQKQPKPFPVSILYYQKFMLCLF